MKRITKTLLLSFLMLVLGLSAATSSLNESSETTVLEEISQSQEVILSLNLLNEPGHQEGSIFTDTTFSAGEYHTCAILDDGSLNCWGDDDYGQLGDGGTNTDKNTPVSVSLGTGRTAVAVSAGDTTPAPFLTTVLSTVGGMITTANLVTVEPTTDKTHLFRFPLELAVRRLQFLLEDTTPAPFLTTVLSSVGGGIPTANLVTVEPTPTRDTPVSVSLGTGRTAVAVSAGDPTPAPFLTTVLSSVGGMMPTANLVTVEPIPTKNTPVSVSLGTGRTAVAVSAGEYHTCAILDDGSLNCWGWDNYGQLGDGGTNTDKNTPVSVSLGTGRTAVAVSAGNYHTCAILDDGSLKCWGYDGIGQLGDGGTNSDKNTPVSVSLGTGRTAVAVSAGDTTPAPFLTTVLSSVGGMIATANLVTVEPTPTRTHLFRFPLERLQIPELLPFLNVILTTMER